MTGQRYADVKLWRPTGSYTVRLTGVDEHDTVHTIANKAATLWPGASVRGVTFGRAGVDWAKMAINGRRSDDDDAQDIAAADRAMAEEGSIPWEQVKAELEIGR